MSSNAVQADGEVTKLMQGPDKEGLVRTLSTSMCNITENEKTKATLAFIGQEMERLATTKGHEYVATLADAIFSLNGLRDVAFGREYYTLLISLAKSWTSLKAYDKAAEADLKILTVPPNMEKNVLPLEKLECIMRLLDSAEHVDDVATTETVLFRAMPQYRRVCRQLMAAQQMESARPVLLAFLEALGLSQQRRCSFVDASRAFAERYEKGSSAFDFERAVVCALLAETSPLRTRQLEAFYLAPESRSLGELGDVLDKAFHVQLLRAKDVATLSHSTAVSGSGIPASALRTAVNQHNIMAISKVFDNISFAALADQLDGMRSDDVGAAVAKMVSEERLRAKVDQASQWIVFRVPDSAAAMTEWDNKLGSVCNAVSHATELITMEYPELRKYLQEED